MTLTVAVVALALALLELVFLAAVLVAAAAWWRKVAPTVQPLLSMFTLPAPTAGSPVTPLQSGSSPGPGEEPAA